MQEEEEGEDRTNKSRSKRKRSQHEEDVLSFEGLVTPNFEELSRRFPDDFGRSWKEVQQNKKSGPLSSKITPEFSIALARALLRVHWGLDLIELPHHHLCPPVPNRHFFVQWIQTKVLPSTIPNFYLDSSTCLTKTGLDIGTGATCIYALLFSASSNNTYQLYATDVDPESVQIAKRNVEGNNMQNSIKVLLVPPADAQMEHQGDAGGDLVAGATGSTRIGPLRRSLSVALPEHKKNPRLDFCMTNPPFFDDRESTERTDPRKGDGRSRTTMTTSEGSYPGGELGFVLDMIVDGLFLFLNNSNDEGKPPVWSSCMCGKKTSWIQLKKTLQTLLGTSHVLFAEFGPGHLTRWFLAWSFERPRARSALAKRSNWQFTVSNLSSEVSIKEGSNRVLEYIQTFPDTNLVCDTDSIEANGQRRQSRQQIQVREKEPAKDHATTNDADRGLPDSIRQLLAGITEEQRTQLFLPPEGHFILYVSIAFLGVADGHIQVNVEAFQHSEYGSKVVDKIKSQMEGEICRTNRRWRRKLKREQQQVPEPMDVS